MVNKHSMLKKFNIEIGNDFSKTFTFNSFDGEIELDTFFDYIFPLITNWINNNYPKLSHKQKIKYRDFIFKDLILSRNSIIINDYRS